jgi:UDP-N-acetylglucosamine--N-acetylmuramyl-(pentapeptide) pyrophosphoryl-undecaprenol N-acetylglucosamine transferase
MTQPLILITAGGTGGHLFPAEALATVLLRLGYRIVLATDPRVGVLAKNFPADEIVQIPSGTPSVRNPILFTKALIKLSMGMVASFQMVRRLKPSLIVSFGGYPTVPPALTASLLKVPLFIHEQNGVMGRANKFLAKRAELIATGFESLRGVPTTKAKQVYTGNPIRPMVMEAAQTPYPAVVRGGKMRILVFGGSQGARIMSEVVPKAIRLIPKEYLPRIILTQQARDDDLLGVRAQYLRSLGPCDVQPFFRDLPRRIADAHLVIGRAGASTVAELSVIGRPSILVPLPGSLDQDQAANAATLGDIGAALVIPQEEFTPQRLAAEIISRMNDGDLLTKAAEAAKTLAKTDAAERLAAYIVRRIGLPTPDDPAEEPVP